PSAPAEISTLSHTTLFRSGFTESTLVIVNPELLRENILGRASCERELGKYDKDQYQKAIEDFQAIIKEGQGTAQYKAARSGLASDRKSTRLNSSHQIISYA